MGGVKLESVHCVKDLGVTITSDIKFSQHCKEVACKANRMLGFIRPTKMIPFLRNKSYEERLDRLNLFSLEKRRLRGKLNECFKILKGLMNVDTNKLFSTDNLPRTRSNGIKFRCRQIELDCTKFFFTNDVVREWNKLPPFVVQYSTVNKNKLDHHLAIKTV